MILRVRDYGRGSEVQSRSRGRKDALTSRRGWSRLSELTRNGVAKRVRVVPSATTALIRPPGTFSQRYRAGRRGQRDGEEAVPGLHTPERPGRQ